jgi:hypothetical protein
MAQNKKIDDVVHVVILDAEVLASELVGLRVHDGQLQTTEAGRPNLILHPDDLHHITQTAIYNTILIHSRVFSKGPSHQIT